MSQTPHQDLIDLKRKGKFMGNYYSQVKKKIHALVDSMGARSFLLPDSIGIMWRVR